MTPSLASTQQADDSTSLCGYCRSLSLDGLRPYVSKPSKGGGDASPSQAGYVLHQDSSELRQAAISCSLCSLIEDALLLALADARLSAASGDQDRHMHTGAIIIEPKADPIGKSFPYGLDDGLFLTGLVVKTFHSTSGQSIPLRGKIRLYLDAPEPSPELRSDLVGRPRLPGPDCDAAFTIITDWLQSCNDQHKLCQFTLAGAAFNDANLPRLPTRVLHVMEDSVQLIHSKGMKGRYAALSHCWGPQDRRPLSTTTANFEQHLAEVPWHHLTANFRDAVTVARRIGMQYLWIDSLCIVQDDDDDWRRESVMMGTIYENAEVTLTASHSKDSHEGFLFPRKSYNPPVELPAFLPDQGASDVRVFATLRYDSAEDTFPEHGILNTRAWATQEWLLSRRMVFFTPGALVWSCKEITQRETGERCYSISRNLGWPVIAERYSDRNLTFAKDRVMALEGLQTEMAKKNGYCYVVGIWKERLPDQLLWQVTEHREPSDVLELPSWSWMHVPCGIRFLLAHKAKSLVTNVAVSSPPKELSLRAWVKEASVHGSDSEPDETNVLRVSQDDLGRSNVKDATSLARFICDTKGDVIGWIVFDTSEQQQPRRHITLVALMGGLLRRDEETERRTGRILSRKLRHYWVLALQQQPYGVYTRVGVGKTYGREWWQDASLETIDIV